jgi:hypothetical protein
MNTLETLLIVENDRHCPCCRMWYLTVGSSSSDDDSQDSEVDWTSTWERRRCAEKYQKISIEIEKEYDLSEYALESNSDTTAEATHLLIMVEIDKSRWCPANIKFFITFFDDYHRLCNYVKKMGLPDIEKGYFSEESGQFFISKELKKGEKFCLNEQCPHLSVDNWLSDNVNKK